MTDVTHDPAAPTIQPAPINGAQPDPATPVPVAKVSQAASKLSETASSTVSQLSDKAGTTAHEFSKVVGERANVARDWAADQTDVLRDTVQTRPFVSAASAFAAGLVVGILLTR